MAEIRVERKRTRIWPWILGLLVAALLVWAVTEALDNDRNEAVATDDDSAALELSIETAPAAVAPLWQAAPADLARAA
jgi:hypothetical protein